MDDQPFFRVGAPSFGAMGATIAARQAITPTLGSVRRTLPEPALPRGWPSAPRIGVISNKRSHRNRGTGTSRVGPFTDMLAASPRTPAALIETLRHFAAKRIDLLVVDGGDGTVRDVLTAAAPIFTDGLPRLAVLPSGKTNALAIDLGIPRDWTMDQLLQSVRADRFVARSPIEIYRRGSTLPDLRGFILGAGAFVQATELAQRTHKMGAFNGSAVGLSLAWGVAQTLFAKATNPWRRGHLMRIGLDDGREVMRPFYLLFGSTLERLPLGIRPFGRPRGGLKMLAIDAPPKRLLVAGPALLTGSEAAWLDEAGYHRTDLDGFRLSMAEGFILDGERYPGGDLEIRTGAPLLFAAP